MLNPISSSSVSDPVIPLSGNGKKGKMGPKAEAMNEMNFVTMMSPMGVPQAQGLEKNPSKNNLGITPSAEIAPSSLKVAASANTAAEIAGPKPWGAQWVFSGREAPDLKPLINSTNTPNIQKELLKLMGSEAEQAPSESSVLTVPISLKGSPSPMQPLGQVMGTGKNMQDGAQLSGDVEMEVQDVSSDLPLPRESGISHNPGLSGAEFLETLGAVKSKEGHKSNLGQSDSDSQNFKMNQPESKLDLRSLKPTVDVHNPNFSEVLAAPVLASSLTGSAQRSAAPVIPAEVFGYVVPGAMAKNRLSSESLLGISNSLKSMSVQGGGEMRIRLKPDNLGELQMRVVARGNDVNLQIRASDPESKKVLEESIKYLKDSMASQRLNLSRVEFVVSQPSGNQTGLGTDSNSSHSNYNNQNYSMNDQMNQQMNNQGYQNRGSAFQSYVDEPMYGGNSRSARAGVSALERNIEGINESRTGIYRENGKVDVLA